MVTPGLYQHYKGNFYQVIGFGLHSETNEELVLYKRADASDRTEIWARPISLFTANLKDGRERFRPVSLEGVCVRGCGRTGLLDQNGVCGVCQLIDAQKRGEQPLEKGD